MTSQSPTRGPVGVSCGHSMKLGPSLEEWTSHRDEITRLYLSGSLPQLQIVMRTKYTFYASKRMYDARFKKWKVRKNMRKVAKQDVSDMSEVEYLGAISHDTHRECWHEDGVADDRPHVMEKKLLTPPQEAPSMPLHQTSPATSDRGSLSSSASSIIYTPDSETSPGYPGTMESLLEPVMFLSSSLRNEEFLLATVNLYFTHRMETIPATIAPESVIHIGSTAASKLLWDNIENGIYLYKISNQFPDKRGRASIALRDAGYSAIGALNSEPFDVLRKIFLVLSPINTAVHPPLRRTLLCCIARCAGQALGSGHPITLVCELLLKEESFGNVANQTYPLALYLEVVQNDPTPDHTRIYAMEGIAEQHMQNRNFSDAADWLLQAQTIAIETSISCQTCHPPHHGQA